MIRRGNDQELSQLVFLDVAGKLAGFAQRAEPTGHRQLTRGSISLERDEEVPSGRLGLLDQVDQPTVVWKFQICETTPLEASHAQNETWREPLLVKLKTVVLSLLFAGEDENGVGRLRRSTDVQKANEH